jgi:hypothetical protein
MKYRRKQIIKFPMNRTHKPGTKSTNANIDL